MFKGNSNADMSKYNLFDVPIIAQWVRINPTRWRDRISMRVELYGCEYGKRSSSRCDWNLDALRFISFSASSICTVSDNLYFNGSSLARLDLLRDPIAATQESIRFRFKTSNANGILLYSRGTQGDYLALQMKENRLILNLDLGSGLVTSLSVGSLLDDNVWHDVVVSRNRRDILFSVDRVIVQGRIKGEFNRLNLNRGVSRANDEFESND